MRKTILVLFSLFAYLSGFAQIGIIEGLNTTTLPTGWSTSAFYNTTTAPCEGTHAWRINFFSDYDPWEGWDYGTLTGSITSPNLTAASNGTDIDVSFDWKATEYSTGSGVGFTMYVEYSLNNGTNWIQIGSPIVANSNTTCDTFTHTIPSASVPVGSNFRFRVRGAWSSGDSYFWIDNISVTQTTEEVPSCIALTSPANGAVNVSSNLLTWSVPNGIPTGYKLKVGTTPGGSQVVNSEDVGPVTSYNLDTLISGATYYVTITPYNLNGDAVGCIETSFTACGSFTDFTQGFETTPTGGIMPECWSRKYVSSSTSATVNVSSSYAKTGARSLSFYNAADGAAKLYAITPILTALQNGTNRIKFSARGTATTTIEVGTMSDPTDDATFNSLMTFPMTTSFQDFAVNFNTATTDQYVAFKANFGGTYTYGYIDDVTWEPIPSCPDVTTLSYIDVTSSTATINWESGDSETAWQYAIGASTVTDPATLTAVDVTGGNPTADLSDLTSNTVYKFWIRANCGSGSLGAWIGPVSFTTACDAFDNFTEGFESVVTGTVMPNCWSRKMVSTSTFTTVNVSSSYAKTGTKSLAFYNSGDSSAELYAITPMLTALPTGTNRIKFSARGSATTSIEVGTLTDPNDETSFSSLMTFPMTTSFQDFVVNFDTATTDEYIAFKANFGSTYINVYIDDVVWETLPTCPDVSTLSYADVTSATATINWEAGNSETAWQYAIGATTVTDPATLTAVDVTGGNPTADLSDLTPSTTYKFWVRANCGSDSFGAWAGPVSFTTLCVAEMAPTAVQTFETAVPVCWSEATGTLSPSITLSGTSSSWGAATSFANVTAGTNKAIKINLYGTKNDWIISNQIDLGNNVGDYRVSYNMALTSYDGTTAQSTLGTHKVSVIVSTDGGETWSDSDIIKTYTGAGTYSNTGQMEKINLSSYSGIVKIAFVASTTSYSPDVHFHIDDFSVEPLPACGEVSELSYTDVTSSTATINWEAGNSETAWQYAIGASTVTDPATLTAVDVTGGNPTADIADLTSNTTYKFWVRANCGSGSFGAWSSPATFTTACLSFAVPSTLENFDGTTGTALPGCWSTAVVSGTTAWTGMAPGTSGDITSTVSGTRIVSKSFSSSDALLFSTPFDYSAITETTRVNLYLHRHALAAAADKYTIYANTTPSLDGAEQLLEVFSKTTLAPTVAATGFYNYTANIPESFNGESQVYIIIQGYTNNGLSSYTLGVDDFKVEYLPACPDVTSLSSENVESTTATIYWEAGGSETAWQYAIGASTVTDPATLTAVDVTGGNPTADLSDLAPNTTYKFWVRSNCGSDSFGAWAGPVSFTTLCVAEMAPTAVQTFETAVPGCWSEATGTLSPSITLSGTSSAWGAATSFANATGGTNKAIKINLYGTKNDWIISNQIDLGNNVGDYRVSYRMALTSYDGTTAQSTLGTHKVSVIVSTDGGETWSDSDIIKTYTGAGTYSNTGKMEKIDLSSYSGIVKIAFVASTTAYSPDVHFHIDDFSVEPLPACADVFNLSYTDVTSSTATLNWQSNGSETAWQYAIGASTVTDPATLTAVDVTGGNPTIGVSDLTSNTTYKFWVRANCGSGSFGVWADPVTFTTACTTFVVPSTLENFDGTTGTALPGCWSTAVVSGTAAWTGMAPGTTGDITSTVSGTRIVSKSFSSSDALLFSTPFDYSTITEATRVNLYLHRHALAAAADKYTIYVNTNPSLDGAEQLLEVFSKTTLAPTVAATGFYNYTADIPESFNGESQVYIIIQGYTNNGLSSYTLGVDDFKIEFSEDLKNPSIDMSSFKLYPNPVKDVLNISYNQNISNVEVFNMLGQQVLAKSVNATEGKVDMSNLAAGTYLVKVAADNQVKTIKVIKQ